jgi:hypothetical protein
MLLVQGRTEGMREEGACQKCILILHLRCERKTSDRSEGYEKVGELAIGREVKVRRRKEVWMVMKVEELVVHQRVRGSVFV